MRNIHPWWAEWAVADWDSGAEAGAGMLAWRHWRHCSGVSSVHWWPLNTQCQLSPERSAVNIFQISHTQYTCDCYQWCCIWWWWWVDESEEWHLMNQSSTHQTSWQLHGWLIFKYFIVLNNKTRIIDFKLAFIKCSLKTQNLRVIKDLWCKMKIIKKGLKRNEKLFLADSTSWPINCVWQNSDIHCCISSSPILRFIPTRPIGLDTVETSVDLKV